MFILSIVPVPMTSGNHNVATNENNLTYLEDRLQDLESLLTAHTLQQYTEATVGGINNNDVDAIKAEIQRIRQKDIELRKATGGDSNVDETERLNEIEGKQAAANQRIKDLENLKQSWLDGTWNKNPLYISGVDSNPTTGDINEVNHELERAKAYKAEIGSMSDFWKKISDGHVGETESTQNTKPLDTDPPENTNSKPLHPYTDPIENTNSSIDLNNLTEDQEAYYNQIKTGLKYVLDDAKNGVDITSKDFKSTSFAMKIFAYLKDLTGVKIEDSKKSEILKYISKIADGSAEDFNGDENFDVADLIKVWETPAPPPPPPPKEAEELAKLSDAVKKLFNDEDPGVDPEELPALLAKELIKLTGVGGNANDRMEAINSFLETGKATDKNGDGEFDYKDLVEIWKKPNQTSSAVDTIVKIIKGEAEGNTFKLKKDLYNLLASQTKKESTLERRTLVSDILKKIANGDMSGDMNGDGSLDYGDVIAAWNSIADPVPPPPPAEEA